jgi:hypothetical protein
MNRTIIISSATLGVLAAVLYVGAQSSAGPQSASSSPQPAAAALGKYVDKDGAIRLPEDYRLRWIHLGSWSVEGESGKEGQVHDVYTEPESVAAFRNTGKFPPGTTLVKEIRASTSGKMTTGNVNWDGPIQQWFVMVKDKETPTFPNNPNWGIGWGWGLYKIDDPKKNISTDYKTDCMPCHVPARQTDWVYTHGYPILHEKEGPFKKYLKEIYEGKK